MLGLFIVPLAKGQSPDNILNKELLPHPFGPVIIQFIPCSILKFKESNNISPFGATMGIF